MKYFLAEIDRRRFEQRAERSCCAEPALENHIRLFNRNALSTFQVRVVHKTNDRYGWIVEVDEVPQYFAAVLKPVCQVCELSIAIGEWPCIATIRPHARSVQGNVFIPYFDFALGEEVTSLAQRKKYMRNLHLDYRDKMNRGDLSARRDRLEERKKEEARG